MSHEQNPNDAPAQHGALPLRTPLRDLAIACLELSLCVAKQSDSSDQAQVAERLNCVRAAMSELRAIAQRDAIAKALAPSQELIQALSPSKQIAAHERSVAMANEAASLAKSALQAMLEPSRIAAALVNGHYCALEALATAETEGADIGI